MSKTWVVLLVLVGASATPAQSQPSHVHAVVDPGMELLAIYLWMSGRYPTPSDSAYKTEVWKGFERYRKLESVTAAKTAKRIFPDFTETGLWLQTGKSPQFVEPGKSSWFDVLGATTVAEIHRGAVAFAQQTGFWRFFDRHRKQYDAWCRAFELRTEQDQTLEKLDSFFHFGQGHKQPTVTIYLEPLNGWGAHAISFDRLMNEPNGDRVAFQLGFSGGTDVFPDTPPEFTNSGSIVPTVWHEGAHVYLHALMERFGPEIDKLDRLFNREQLKSQNIGSWRYCFEENVVRAVVAVLVRKYEGEDAYKREVVDQTRGRGFIYAFQLAETIWAGYASKGDRPGTFEDFFPEILKSMQTLRGPADARFPN